MYRAARYTGGPSHNVAAGVAGVERDLAAAAVAAALDNTGAGGGAAAVVRCCAVLDPDVALADALAVGAEVDGVGPLAPGDRVLVLRTPIAGGDGSGSVFPPDADNGPWVVRADGPPDGEAAPVALGLLVYVSEGEAYAATAFVCVAVEVRAADGTAPSAAFAFQGVAGGGGAAAATATAKGPLAASASYGIDDLVDAVARPASGVLALGRGRLGVVGPDNVLVGAAAGTALTGTAAANNTIVGGYAGAAGASGRVVLADGRGRAALAVDVGGGGRKCTACGPDAHRVFGASSGPHTWLGAVDPADLALSPGAGTVILADGAGHAALAAVPARGNVWVGPGSKRLFSALAGTDGTVTHSVRLGGATAADGPGAAGTPTGAVVVADGAGNVALAAQPNRGALWLGPGARRLFAAAGGANHTVVGDAPATALSSAAAAVVLAGGGDGTQTGTGTVRLHAVGRSVRLAPRLEIAAAAPADGLTHVGVARADTSARAANQVAVGAGDDAVRAYCDAAGNAALGPAAATVAQRAAAAAAYTGHTAIGGAAPPAQNPNDATPGAAYAGALVVSDGAGALVHYADATGRAWLGPAGGAAGGGAVPPVTPALRGTDAAARGVARHGYWIGRCVDAADGDPPPPPPPPSGPVTIADPNRGDLRWHCDAAGRVSWSTPVDAPVFDATTGAILCPAGDNMLALSVDRRGAAQTPYGTLHLRVPGVTNGTLACPLGRMTPT